MLDAAAAVGLAVFVEVTRVVLSLPIEGMARRAVY